VLTASTPQYHLFTVSSVRKSERYPHLFSLSTLSFFHTIFNFFFLYIIEFKFLFKKIILIEHTHMGHPQSHPMGVASHPYGVGLGVATPPLTMPLIFFI
jgi:hypothetical protein